MCLLSLTAGAETGRNQSLEGRPSKEQDYFLELVYNLLWDCMAVDCMGEGLQVHYMEWELVQNGTCRADGGNCMEMGACCTR